MQVFRVMAVPFPDSGWTDDPFTWARRLIDHDEASQHREICAAERCGIEFSRVEHVPVIVVLLRDFEQAMLWVHWLASQGCDVAETLTIDDYLPPSVPSSWLART